MFHRDNGRVGVVVVVAAMLALQAMPSRVCAHRLKDQDSKAIIRHWVRFPFEWQLLGIDLGAQAVDRDDLNRIVYNSVAGVYKSPDGIIVGKALPTKMQGGEMGAPTMGGPGGGGRAGGPGGPGGPGGAGPARVGPGGPGEAAGLGGAAQPVPEWALSVWVDVDPNSVEWVYKRSTYNMGFVIDQMGFVTAICVAGTKCPTARTQLGDPNHTIQLGDPMWKVLYRYGYADDVDLYQESSASSANEFTYHLTRLKADPPPAGEEATFSNTFATCFNLKYHQSYNVIFTIREKKVVRIMIFGDPDYFRKNKRKWLRDYYYGDYINILSSGSPTP